MGGLSWNNNALLPTAPTVKNLMKSRRFIEAPLSFFFTEVSSKIELRRRVFQYNGFCYTYSIGASGLYFLNEIEKLEEHNVNNKDREDNLAADLCSNFMPMYR
jgi:hypothetical protein